MRRQQLLKRMENLKNSLVLFDVDGTLTEARQRINKRMLQSLKELSFNTEIGLLTGSGLDYIKEQLWPLLADPDDKIMEMVQDFIDEYSKAKNPIAVVKLVKNNATPISLIVISNDVFTSSPFFI